jgi:hypothetical protein
MRLLLGFVLLSVVVAVLRPEQLAGDPRIYRERMLFLFAGEIPYLDFYFEHLPLAIVPMAVAWLLGGAFHPVAYSAIFAILMAACLFVTVPPLVRTGKRTGVTSPATRWILISCPLFPIVLFRYEPLVVLLAVLAIDGLTREDDRHNMTAAIAGVLTKGWVAIVAIVEWLRGFPLRAVALVATTIAMFGLLFALPGFYRVREFGGLHSESVFGGGFIQWRVVTGQPFHLISDAGATYVAVPSWAVVVNLIIGLVVLAIALYGARGEFAWPKGIRLLAAATLAILIGSPLLSPQFLLWPTPFLALHSSVAVRRLGIAATALTLLYMLGWNPGFRGDLWWVGVMNLRNLVLIALGMVAALSVGDRPVARPTGAAS